MWTYEQSTGYLRDPTNHVVGRGYAGNGSGLNNPSVQDVHNLGPLPRGLYTIGEMIPDHPKVGEYALPLTPDPKNEMFGRSDFYMHGDNPSLDHTASDGCVVQQRIVREMVNESEDRQLQVIE